MSLREEYERTGTVAMQWSEKKNNVAIDIMHRGLLEHGEGAAKYEFVGAMTSVLVENLDHAHLSLLYAELVYRLASEERP
jgi:hypothetical protein